MFIAYSATLIDPEKFNALIQTDSQLVLPTLVLQHTPVFAQAIFFGAVLAAIMSCSSATLLAPSVAFSENILRGFFPGLGDKAFLRMMRITIVCFTVIVLAFALNTNASIFKMVENAYKVTLAGAFVPLFFGAYWSRATTQGALAATIGGLTVWLLVEFLLGQASLVPPQLTGLAASLFGMIAGSLLPQWIGRPSPQEDLHHALHHRAAAETHHVGEHPHRH
jgi:Na+/proline symporter